MTNTDNDLFDYHKQCLTCNLSADLVESIHAKRSEGLSYPQIAAYAANEFSIIISPDALSNHLKFHAKEKVEPILGVVKPPKGFEPRLELEGDEGKVVTTPQTDDKITDFSKILEEFGVDPEEFEIDGSVKMSKWQSFTGDWLTAYKFDIKRKKPEATEVNLPTLFSEVRAELQIRDTTNETPSQDRTVVVGFADLQAGKVGSRGDSKALVERSYEKLEKLDNYIDKQNCASSLFLDAGDIVESFENTAQQGFTNDLSIMEQLDLAGTIEQEFISLLAGKHEQVTVAGVPSNHGAWRKGKDILGRPSDDWGLFLLKQIQKAYSWTSGTYDHVSFQFPDEWSKSLNIDVQGSGVGLVHGEDSSLANMENWWAKQVHGAAPVAVSDVLVTGHYHTFGIKTTGRSLRTGKQKYWLSLPTLDNGSDWWANKSGADSDPGLMVWVMDKTIGLDIQSIAVL